MFKVNNKNCCLAFHECDYMTKKSVLQKSVLFIYIIYNILMFILSRYTYDFIFILDTPVLFQMRENLAVGSLKQLCKSSKPKVKVCKMIKFIV